MGFYSQVMFPRLCELLLNRPFVAKHRQRLLASSDNTATLPADFTLINGVGWYPNPIHAGTGFFNVKLMTDGNQTITATDTADGNLTATVTVVNAVPAFHFIVSTPSTVTSGAAFDVTVTALDQFNNPAPDYSGAVYVSGPDYWGTYQAQTLTDGVGVFSITLRSTGYYATPTAADIADGTINGNTSSYVAPAAADYLAVLQFDYLYVVQGQPLSFQVWAFDRFGGVKNQLTTGSCFFISALVQANRWFAAAFHLRQLLKERPNDAELQRQLERAEAQWKLEQAPKAN